MDDVSSLARLLLMTLITHDDAVHRSLSLQRQWDDSYAPIVLWVETRDAREWLATFPLVSFP